MTAAIEQTPYLLPELLPREVFAAVRRRTVVEHCKWDPQVGDVSTLAPFPLVLRAPAWGTLARAAESLAAELMEAEAALLRHPSLLRVLGLPPRVIRVLSDLRSPLSGGAGRILRFDFHWTHQGWRISEVNSDVPGGYAESTGFTELVAALGAGAPTGRPGRLWAETLAAAATGPTVVLLATPGLPEDQQVNYYLGGLLQACGLMVQQAGPEQVRWCDGRASLAGRPIHLLWRFYQAEWLPRLSSAAAWPHYFRGSRTPVANPGVAITTESKRFPLIWDALRTAMPTWREVLPETCDTRHCDWTSDAAWVVKRAFSCTGEAVHGPGLTPPQKWQEVCRQVRRHPDSWVAQRRFDTVSVATPWGPMRPCIGVYTVDGRAAGCYGRLTSTAIVDFSAVDVAVLVEEGA